LSCVFYSFDQTLGNHCSPGVSSRASKGCTKPRFRIASVPPQPLRGMTSLPQTTWGGWSLSREIMLFIRKPKGRSNMISNHQHGWVCFERAWVFSGIQFTKILIEFVVVETKDVVRSNSNVILTRQTCGQHSSRFAGSKHRALAFYFSVRIWHVLLISIFQ